MDMVYYKHWAAAITAAAPPANSANQFIFVLPISNSKGIYNLPLDPNNASG